MNASGLIRRVALDDERSEDPPVRLGRSEELRLRNYDGDTAHLVRIEVRGDGGVAFEETLRLDPGGAESLTPGLDPGRYDVVAELSDGRTDAARCRIGAGTESTAVIELGNGIVSVSEVAD